MSTQRTDGSVAAPRQTLRQLCVLVFILVFSVKTGVAQQVAPVIVPDPEAPRQSLAGHLDVLVDATRQLSVEAVAAPERSDAWRPAPEGLAPDVGKDAAYWLRFRVQATGDWLLEVRADEAVAYWQQADGTWTARRTGYRVPTAERDVPYAEPPLLRLDAAPGQPRLVYLRVTNDFGQYVTAGEAVVPAVRPAALVAARERAQRYGQGIFAGMMAAMLLYNLFLFVSIRDRSYLYYVFFLLAVTLFWMVRYGYLQTWYWPQGWHTQPSLLLYTIALSVVFYLCFARSFLQVGREAPRLSGLLRLVIAAQAVPVVLGLAGYWVAAQNAMAWTVIAALLTALAAALLQWRAGFRPACFFLAASIAFISGTLVYTAAWFGLLPKMFFTTYSPQMGVLAEVLLFSLGLADRINILQQERQQALAAAQVAEAQSAVLRETDELKTQLLNLAAHDLRSPLTGIHGFAVMLRTEVEEGAGIQEPLLMIESASRQMLTLIEDLLNTVAIESGHLHLSLSLVNVREVAEEVVRAYRPRAALKDQRIAFRAASTIEAEADAGRLREAIDNLVSNAVKYAPRGSAIEVAVERVDGYARFYVRDEGPGLTEEDRALAFGYYRRLSAAPTGDEPSTGLGLAITKRLIELQGGRVWVESTMGQGSRFGFDLPLAAAVRVAA